MTAVSNNLADKAESVGMDTRGGDSHKHIPDFHLAAVYEPGFLHHSGSISGYIIFSAFIHTRHLRGLSADKSASCLTASFRHSCHYGLYLLRNIVSHSHIIKKYQRFGALCQHIIDAHGHDIYTHGIMLVHRKRDLEFGAHSVSSADKHRLLDTER